MFARKGCAIELANIIELTSLNLLAAFLQQQKLALGVGLEPTNQAVNSRPLCQLSYPRLKPPLAPESNRATSCRKARSASIRQGKLCSSVMIRSKQSFISSCPCKWTSRAESLLKMAGWIPRLRGNDVLVWCCCFQARPWFWVEKWRKVEESNPYGSPYPGFQDRLPTIQRHLPKGATDETCSRSVSARRNSLELASQTSASTALASATLVEARRLELLTFCLQSSCSPIELRPQVDGNFHRCNPSNAIVLPCRAQRSRDIPIFTED